MIGIKTTAVHKNKKTIIYITKTKVGDRLKKHRSVRKSADKIRQNDFGLENQNIVSKKLSGLGISNKQMPWRHTFDILLSNGIKVDVKSSSPGYYTTNSPMYTFPTKKGKKGNYCDFLVLVTDDSKEFFVVPIKICKGIIRFCFPITTRRGGFQSRWIQYYNRFDLLQ